MIPLRLDEVAAVTRGRLASGADAAALVSGPVVIDWCNASIHFDL